MGVKFNMYWVILDKILIIGPGNQLWLASQEKHSTIDRNYIFRFPTLFLNWFMTCYNFNHQSQLVIPAGYISWLVGQATWVVPISWVQGCPLNGDTRTNWRQRNTRSVWPHTEAKTRALRCARRRAIPMLTRFGGSMIRMLRRYQKWQAS